MARRRHTTKASEVSISGMPDPYVACRSLGHAWDYYDVTVLDRPRRYMQTVACMRCAATRSFELDLRGSRTGTARCRYPDGYLIRGGAESVADRRAQARLELMARHRDITNIATRRRRRAS